MKMSKKNVETFEQATNEEVAMMKGDNGQALAVVQAPVDSLITQSQASFYSSIVATDRKGKIALYNAINNTENQLADHINKELDLTDVIVTLVEVINEETGELEKAPRCILIDKDGVAYNSVSKGIHSSVKNLVSAFGEPSLWKAEPIKVLVKQVRVTRGSMLTLEVLA